MLGGTKEVGVSNGRVDEEVTRGIMMRCRGIADELLTGRDGGFEVAGAMVGLRPARRGGARVEREVVDGWTVVHAYGHSGAGWVWSMTVWRL